MGKEVVLFKSEEKSPTGEIAEFLRQLADKVEAREVILRRGDEEIVLALPQILTLEVKAEEEVSSGGIKNSLEVELEWRPGENEKGKLELG